MLDHAFNLYPKLKLRIISFFVFTVLGLQCHAFPFGVTSNQPDMCRKQLYSNAQQFDSFSTAFGTAVRIYAAQEVMQNFGSPEVPVVVLINGNKIAHNSYMDLSNHLANNGYLVLLIHRLNGNNASVEQSVNFLDVIDDVFAMYQLHPDSPLGVLGHSVGGSVAMEVTKLNQIKTNVYNLQALITLAPKADFVISRNDPINAQETPAYFSIYGSMDNDVNGFTGSKDAYSAYDFVGNEQSTYTGDNPDGELFKSMLFVHGAGHRSLVGDHFNDNQNSPDIEYISTSDQFCITKAYVTSFLNWHLKDQNNFSEFFTPPYFLPHSVSIMQTAAPDYMNLLDVAHPAGSPLRMFFQSSPEIKSVVQSFHGVNQINNLIQSGDVSMTEVVNAMIIAKEAYKETPFFLRNMTTKLGIQWGFGDWNADNQFIGFKVPEENQNAQDFSHVSLRIGQIHNEELFADGEEFKNPTGAYQKVILVLRDLDGKEVFTYLNDWGRIPFNDVRMHQGEVRGHSGMNTISVPLWVFQRRLNLAAIEYVGLVFDEGSTGTIVVDNIEWVMYSH